MNILAEIVEKSDDIIAILDSNDFFGKNIFCPKTRLKIELQIRMQCKWDQEGDINLTTEEFAEVVSCINTEEIAETLYGLVDKGILSLSVDANGELSYTLSKESVEIHNKGDYIKIFRKEKYK
jgi:hypothetical protein